MPPNTDDLRIRSFAPLSTPADLLRELPCSETMSDTVADARRVFDGLSYSNKRRIVMPIEDAKTPETRQRRIDKAVEALREGRL